jgi:hypothetical protein
MPELHNALGGLGTVDLDLRNAGGGDPGNGQRDNPGTRPGDTPSTGQQRDPTGNGEAGGQHRRRAQNYSDDRLDQWM